MAHAHNNITSKTRFIGKRVVYHIALCVLMTCSRSSEPAKKTCGDCHRAQFDAWSASHHARGQEQTDAGFVIGFEPVRQLVVEVDGRLQVEPVNLLTGEPVPSSLHGPVGDWRGPRYAWAGSCASCHATGFQVNAMKWKALNVSCEACHVSSGGAHRFTSIARKNTFEFVDGGAIARASEVHRDTQTETCAQCHMRRRALVDDGVQRPLLDAFEPELMNLDAFEANGAMKEEVFEAASFLMSKMQRAGVRCSHCHEPHSGELRAQGNALCSQCHQASVFDVVAHRGESSCVDCHMPSKTFLGVDKRHDHSFVVPGRSASTNWLEVARDTNESDFKRASALTMRKPPLSRDAVVAIAGNFTSQNDWLRYGTASALPSLPEDLRRQFGGMMLHDPRRAIRVKAARALAIVTEDFVAAERANSFSGDSWLNLGAVERVPRKAAALYRRGLEVDPAFVPLAINLADVSGDEGPLREAVKSESPWRDDARYALGLAAWRRGEKTTALKWFREARDSGVEAHCVAWSLAERELNGVDAGCGPSP
ncbi:MAG: cytochrome c3 family protein [Archangium sp.]